MPGLMVAATLLLAMMTPRIDRMIPAGWLSDLPIIFSGAPVNARTVLSTIATSMITIAGVVFSMTIVSLQLASSQFGPRLLRTFLRDTANQVVLGTFVATFLYCIVILPSVDSRTDAIFVPQLSVTIAIVLAVISLGMLVFFIDHVAQSIHADAVIQSVATELDYVIDDLYPANGAENEGLAHAGTGNGMADEEVTPDSLDQATGTVHAPRSGYIRFINRQGLLQVANEMDLVIRLLVLPGAFVMRDQAIASVALHSKASGDYSAEIRQAFGIGTHRTALQDVRFAFEQLSEMAIRALSPGINDPTTATHCVNRIGAGLVRLVERAPERRLCRDEGGTVRVVVERLTLADLLSHTMIPIARNAGRHIEVWTRMLHVLQVSHERSQTDTYRDAIGACGLCVADMAEGSFESTHDIEQLRDAAAWAKAGSD